MTIFIIIGSLFILLGLLVVRFPLLISGYNTMSQEEKAFVDIVGYARLMRLVFIVMGIALIAVPYLLKYLDLMTYIETFVLITIFGGAGIVLWKGREYGMSAFKKSKTNKITLWIALGITAIVFAIVGYTAIPAKICVVDSKLLVISGAYGVKLPKEFIEKAEIRDSLPVVRMRSNGTSIGNLHKGWYQMEELGKVKMFLHSGKPPYLIIYPKMHPPIIINRSTEEEVMEIYKEIKP